MGRVQGKTSSESVPCGITHREGGNTMLLSIHKAKWNRIRSGHLYIDVATYLTAVTQGRIYRGSQFEDAVYHGGDIMREGT